MLNKDRNIYTIIGPTAIGKSKIAIDLVEKYPFEIISLDSSMIFREMNIGTDKPDSRILSKYKHHLIDIINPNALAIFKGLSLKLNIPSEASLINLLKVYLGVPLFLASLS